MQLRLFKEPTADEQVPTISTMPTGSVFARTKPAHKGFLYMAVSICGGIRYEVKDERDCLIMNLATGRVFSAFGSEEVIPKPFAAVLEDTKLQVVQHREPIKRK